MGVRRHRCKLALRDDVGHLFAGMPITALPLAGADVALP